MVKHLASKRTDKSLTVEAFWDIKQSLKTRKAISRPINPNIEQKVATRFRFQRHKTLVKQFNPLSILLQNKIDPQDTHTSLLISDKLPKSLSKFRSMSLTLPLILHNLPILFKTLTDNLDTHQSWQLLVSLLRDTTTESFHIFLVNLEKLTTNLTDTFENQKFKSLFAVIATFLETNFEMIKGNLVLVWREFTRCLFKHFNKYVRRFSLESMAYVLGRVDREVLEGFYREVMGSREEGAVEEELSWVMFYQMKIIGGFITHLGVDGFGRLWEFMYGEYSNREEKKEKKKKEIIKHQDEEQEVEVEKQKQSETEVNQHQYRERILRILTLLLDHLATRLTLKQYQSDQIMFNLIDLLKVVQSKSINLLKSSSIQCQSPSHPLPISPSLHCFHKTLTTNKYAKSHPQLLTMTKHLCEACLSKSPNDGIFYQLLAVYLYNTKQSTKDKYYNCLKSATIRNRELFLNELIEQSETNQKYVVYEGMVGMLVLVFGEEIRQVLVGSGEKQEEEKGGNSQSISITIYKLCIILSKSGFKEKIRMEKLAVKSQEVEENVKRQVGMLSFDREQGLEVLSTLLPRLKLTKYIDLQTTATLKSLLCTTLQSLNTSLNQILLRFTTSLTPSTSTPDPQGPLFHLPNFLPQLTTNSQILPTITFLLNLKQFIVEFESTHNVQILDSSLELPFRSLFNSRIKLVTRFNTNKVISHQLLSSRIREVRKYHLDRLQQTELVKALSEIDSEQIDLQNEREVKRLMLEVARMRLREEEVQVVVYWAIGFAFTGFKLIEQPFINLLSTLLTNYPAVTSQPLLSTLKFLNFKMSRKFPIAFHEYLQSNITPIDGYSTKSESPLTTLLSEQYILLVNEARELSGFEKIVRAVEGSEVWRRKNQGELKELLDGYFAVEFCRSRRMVDTVLQDNHYQGQKPLKLLPPHPSHLSLILHLLPTPTYLPTYSILHHSHTYLKLFSARGLKSLPWQTIWQKKKDDQTSLNLTNKLSIDEQHLYLNYLWKLILESDERRRNAIFEHVRTQLEVDVEYFLGVCLGQVFLRVQEIKEGDSKVREKLELIPEKLLVSFLHISATFISMLKIQMKPYISSLSNLYVTILSLCSNQQDPKTNKLLRKTCTKSLTILYKQFAIFPHLVKQSAQDLLSILEGQLEKLSASATSAVPGVLRIVNEWSRTQAFHCMFNKKLLGNIGEVYKRENVKKEAVEMCNLILLRLFGVEEVEMGEEEIEEEQVVPEVLKESCEELLTSYLTYYTSKPVPTLQSAKLLQQLCLYSPKIPQQYCQSLITSVSKLITDHKHLQKNNQLLTLLFSILQSTPIPQPSFLPLIQLIPQLPSSLKLLLITTLSTTPSNPIRPPIHKLSLGLHSTLQKGVQILPDYDKIFTCFKQIQTNITEYSSIEKEYIALQLVKMVECGELSIRSSASEIIGKYLDNLEEMGQFKRVFKVVLHALRVNAGDETKFYSTVQTAGQFVKWLQRLRFEGCSDRDRMYRYLGLVGEGDKNFFKLVVSISQNSKLKAINLLKSNLQAYKTTHNSPNISQPRHQLPNLITSLLLPILQQLIFSTSKGNLSSSLSLTGTKLHGSFFSLLSFPEIKQQFKRLLLKLNFKQTHSKHNILLMKLVSEILDSIEMKGDVLERLKENIMRSGLEVLNYQRESYEFEGQEEEEQEEMNQQYIKLDRKMIEVEEVEEEVDPMVAFLRKNVLVPLKSMLFFESRSDPDNDKEATSRLFLAVVLTKLLLRLPLQIFVIEFSKVVSKLSRMLKKKQQPTRDNARKCLSQIVKLTGAPLLHVVFRQMSFHLTQNFQKHILTYSMHYILSQLTDQPQAVDYCLPIVLPRAFQDIFGQSSQEKQLANDHQIPTLAFEVKKRKGFELLNLACRLISPGKLQYVVEMLRGELKRQMISEERLGRFENVINNVVAGLGKNAKFTEAEDIVPLLGRFIKESSERLRLFEINEGLNENEVRRQLDRKRAVTKSQTFTLQAQAGRSGSIFRKVNKDVVNKRNTDLLTSSLCNLHLSLVLMCLKKGLLNSQSHLQFPQHIQQIVLLVIECLQHNNNTVLVKSLKITSIILKWTQVDLIQTHKKKIATLVLSNLDSLTSTQQDLARQSLSIINFILKDSIIPSQLIPPLLSHIRLHIQTNTKQSYELLKTLVIKHVKHPELRECIEQIKQTMITTYDDEIRRTTKSVYVCYLRNYQRDKEKEIMFLVKNVDYTEVAGRAVVLEVLEEFLGGFTKTEVEHYAEILWMSLLAVYSTEEVESIRTRIQNLQQKLLKSINKAKVKGIVEQGLCWAEQQEEDGIRINGVNVFYLVMKCFPEVVMEKEDTIVGILRKEIKKSAEKLEMFMADVKERANQQNRLRTETSWNKIISEMVEEPELPRVVCLPRSLELAKGFRRLLEDKEFIRNVCTLVCYPKEQIHIPAMQILASSKLQQTICQSLLPLLQSLSQTITTLRSPTTIPLLLSLLSLPSLTSPILIMLRRSVHHSIKSKDLSSIAFLTTLLSSLLSLPKIHQLIEQHRTTLVQTVAKLMNQRQLVGEENYGEIQQLVEKLKGLTTPAVFYQEVQEMRERKREKERVRRAEFQQMAITEPERYNREKVRNNRKKVKKL